jgi:hypothetical protein
MHTVFWLEILKGGDHSEDLCVDGRIILKWILGIGWEEMDRMHLAGDRGSVVRPCEHSNELSGWVKGREFLD